MKQSQDIKELATALAKAQGEFETAKKTAENPFFKSNYADLASVMEVIRAPLAKNGLCIVQGLDGDIFETILMHSSGQWISFAEPFRPAKGDPQSIGSLKSYLKRYAILGILGIATDDDDAEKAMVRESPSGCPAPVTSVSSVSASPVVKPKKLIGALSEAQIKRMFAIAKSHGWSVEHLKEELKSRYGIESSAELTRQQYDEMCDTVIPAPAPVAGELKAPEDVPFDFDGYKDVK